MTAEEHRERHKMLHALLDELLACYICTSKGKSLSTTTLMDFLQWSFRQTKYALATKEDDDEHKITA